MHIFNQHIFQNCANHGTGRLYEGLKLKMGKSENEETERKAGYGCDLAPKIPEGRLKGFKRPK